MLVCGLLVWCWFGVSLVLALVLPAHVAVVSVAFGSELSVAIGSELSVAVLVKSGPSGSETP